MSVPTPADEKRHEKGPERLWSESWYMDWFDDEGKNGGYVRLAVCSNLNECWFWCCIVGEDQKPVFIIDHDAAIPDPPGLEIRSTGLWADLAVESPLEYFSVGVEAFGVALDDPREAYGDMRGEKVPVGIDLGWATDSHENKSDGSEPWAFHYDVTTRYEIPCRVSGEVQVGEKKSQIDGWGQRDHSWAERDWWDKGWTWFSGRFEDGSRFHAVAVEGHDLGIGYHSSPDGLIAEHRIVSNPQLGPEGIPTNGHVTLGETVIEFEPIGWAPVLLTDPDNGHISRFPRGLVSIQTNDGRKGHAWIEFNQPQK